MLGFLHIVDFNVIRHVPAILHIISKDKNKSAYQVRILSTLYYFCYYCCVISFFSVMIFLYIRKSFLYIRKLGKAMRPNDGNKWSSSISGKILTANIRMEAFRHRLQVADRPW